MRPFRIILFIFFVIYSNFLLNLVTSCMSKKKPGLCACIKEMIKKKNLGTDEASENSKFSYEDIQKCAVAELERRNIPRYFIINNPGYSFVDLNRLYSSKLKKRFDQAEKCLKSIDYSNEKKILDSVSCCTGKNSHIGMSYENWKDDDYHEQYRKCMDHKNEVDYIFSCCSDDYD